MSLKFVFKLTSLPDLINFLPMNKETQLIFESLNKKNSKCFGGSHLKNSNPKERRPISTKKAMHLVLRSTLATRDWSLLKADQTIKRIISSQGKKHGVKIYRQANGGNHLHLVVLPRSREAFHKFIRAVSGLIARIVLGAERGSAMGIKFWDKRPFTRIIEWGKEFSGVSKYVLQNTLEALGFVPYRPRRHWHKTSNQVFMSKSMPNRTLG